MKFLQEVAIMAQFKQLKTLIMNNWNPPPKVLVLDLPLTCMVSGMYLSNVITIHV